MNLAIIIIYCIIYQLELGHVAWYLAVDEVFLLDEVRRLKYKNYSKMTFFRRFQFSTYAKLYRNNYNFDHHQLFSFSHLGDEGIEKPHFLRVFFNKLFHVQNSLARFRPNIGASYTELSTMNFWINHRMKLLVTECMCACISL